MDRRLLVLAALLAAAPAGAANLLPNPGLEGRNPQTGLPEGWTLVAGQGVQICTERPRQGRQCVRFHDESPEEGISLESRRLPCDPGWRYTASAWVRTPDRCQPGLYLQFHDESGRRIAEQHVRAEGPCPKWTRLQVSFPTPADATAVSVLLYAYIGDVGRFDCDDVALVARKAPGAGRKPMVVASAAKGEKKTPVTIDDRLQLFVDRYLIDALAGAELRLHSPQPREVAIPFDRPWEGPVSFYVTVLVDGDTYRAYYRGQPGVGHPEVTCYAESKDGIVWTKPALGLYEFQGSTENNILWMGEGTHNFTPFLDQNPAARPEERYKALAGGPLIALCSPDGIHWRKLRDEPVITQGAFDSQNLAFWDSARGRYAAYFRGFRDDVRAVLTATSTDFLNWTEPEWIDLGDSRPEHFYTNATTPYFRAPEILLCFPKRFVPERTWNPEHGHPGLSDGLFLTSRDGRRFDRTFLEAFIRPGPDPENWTERNIGIAYGVVPTGPGEISLYWVEHYRHPTCRLRRGVLRTDGFVSLHAGYAGGEALTRPLLFAGKELVLNFATSAAGSVRVELQDEKGKPLPGFSLAECPAIYGDELERVVRWRDGADVSSLAGRRVRLRFRLQDADLYSFRFRG